MAVSSSSRAVVLLVVVVLAGAAVVATASSGAASAPENSDTMPSILKPVAHTPLGSFEGAGDGPVADDALNDEEAAPVGSPIGTTMTEPEPELAPPGPPGDDSSGATAAYSVLFGGPAAAAAALAAAAAIFAF